MSGGISVLVVGGGMYVTGRGSPGSRGTVLPALLEARRNGAVGEIGVITTSNATARVAADVAKQLGDQMGVDGSVMVFPDEGPNAFFSATETMNPVASIVSVPDHLHADVCIPIVEKGIHCLVVKPLAGSSIDARRMVEAAARAGVVAQVEFHKRLDESNILLRDSIRSERLGVPLYAVIEYSQRKTIPEDVFRSWAAQSNIFQYLGVHYVDLLLWATGYSPRRVTAWGQKSFLVSSGVDTWDAMQVIIEWDTGSEPFVSTHITNWIDPNQSSAMSDQKINVVGTDGRFQADQKNRGVQVVTDESGVEDINPYFTVSHNRPNGLHFSGYGISSVQQFIDDVADVVSGRKKLSELLDIRPTFAQGCISTIVLEAALQSIGAENTPVEVKIPENLL